MALQYPRSKQSRAGRRAASANSTARANFSGKLANHGSFVTPGTGHENGPVCV